MIPQGRMSTTPVEGVWIQPEDRKYIANKVYERGPTDIEDISAGLLFQNWEMFWDYTTGDFTVTGETNAATAVVHNAASVKYSSFTFDQTGRVSLTYSTPTSSFMLWYDTEAGQTVLTDLGADIISPSLQLDDKRSTQTSVSDMLLWLCRVETGTDPVRYELVMRMQRERFLIDYVMLGGLETPYIHNVGLTRGLRIQLYLSSKAPIPG